MFRFGINNQVMSCFGILSLRLSRYRLYMGRHRQEGSNPNEQSRTVTRIINHPDYNDRTSDNDIALLRLSSPVNFTDYIVPACLAAPNSTFFAGVDVWVTGWGTTSFGGGFLFGFYRSIWLAPCFTVDPIKTQCYFCGKSKVLPFLIWFINIYYENIFTGFLLQARL